MTASKRATDAQDQQATVRAIEVIDTAQGKPHILYVVCAAQGVREGEELLTDYGACNRSCLRAKFQGSEY